MADSKLIDTLHDVHVLAYFLALCIFLLLSIHLIWKCISRRLWLFPCYPTRFTALNAGTLALLGISARGPNNIYVEASFCNVAGSILACAVIGACMPSIASTDRSQMWSNFAGTALLLMTITFNIFYFSTDTDIEFNQLAAACLILFILVLFVQTLSMDEMIPDVAVCVSMRLQQFELKAGPAISDVAEEQVRFVWNWESLERTTCIKLMMALTSNLQNIGSRSPSSAILVALILSSAAQAGRQYQLDYLLIGLCFYYVSTWLFGFICVSRWLRLAMYDDRPLPSLLLDTHPFYWRRRKVTHFLIHLRAGPPRPLHPTIWQQITFTLKSIVYCILAFMMLFFITPLYWVLLTCITSTHTFSTLFFRMSKTLLLVPVYWLIVLPVKALFLRIRSKLLRCSTTVQMPVNAPDVDLAAGVIYVPGESPRTVQKLFEGSARLAIQRGIKQAETKPVKALETILKLSNQAFCLKNNVVHEVLDQRGTPDVTMLPSGEHGDQYGWSLTIVSLLEVLSMVEVGVFGTFRTTIATMEAYKQAIEMVAVVDKMHAPNVCSIETYLKASDSLWVSLLSKNSRSWLKGLRHVQVADGGPVDILEMRLETARRELQKHSHVFSWAMEEVQAYTMYTVCENLRRWCLDVESAAMNGGGTGLIEHIQYLMVEVLAGCLCSLPAVLETCMSRAVCNGHVAEIETGISIIHQAQQMWKELEWPLMYTSSVALPGVSSAAGFPLKQYWLRPKPVTNDTPALSYRKGHSWPRQPPNN